MRKRYGQSLVEYGVIAALVAVVAIPAITLLSNNTGNLLGNMIQTDGSNNRIQGTRVGTSNSVQVNTDGANANASVEAQIAANTGRAVYNPETGQYTFPVMEANGGGTTTASVSGNEAVAAMAQQFNAMADAVAKSSEPGSGELASFFRNLARQAEKIADEQSGDIRAKDLAKAADKYGELFKKYDDLAQKYPGSESLRLAGVYTGIIAETTVTSLNNTDGGMEEISKIKDNDKGWNALMAAGDEFKATSTADLTQEERAALTYDQAENLGGL